MYDCLAMAKTARSRKPVAQFDFPMRVQVRRGRFEPLDTIGLLDRDKLKRGTHKICVGHVRGGCCPAKAVATVRGGQVVDVSVEACKDRKKLTPIAQAILREAQRRGHLRKRSKWTPVPVDRFFTSSQVMAKIVVSGWETEDGGCAQVCWGDGPILDCVWCCRSKDELDCGLVQVVVGDLFRE
jgi:hypothetical protein